MQWWCAAQTQPWSWAWQPYPGVWLFMLLVVGMYGLLLRRQPPAAADGRRARRGRIAWFAAGALILWASLDWPIGALGSGYLASIHMVQFIMMASIAPPLLLLGVPREAWAALARRARSVSVLRVATHPVSALATFHVIIISTHLPVVVDSLMVSQWGSFLIDILWLGGGLLFWWPIISPVPQRRWFPEPVKMVYIIAHTILKTAPSAFLTFSEFPLYAVYELAPPIDWAASAEEQRVAGLLMKMIGGGIYWTAISVLFYQWATKEGRREPKLLRVPKAPDVPAT
jgi:putative membrane protein